METPHLREQTANQEEVDILLIEDNPVDAEVTLKLLQKFAPDKKVFHAASGIEALEFLFAEGTYASRKKLQPPYLIFLDLKMPKVDGFQVLKRIRSYEPTKLTPVLVFTSSGEPIDIIKCYEFGANSYMTKPIDYEKFGDAIKAICQYWMEYCSIAWQVPTLEDETPRRE